MSETNNPKYFVDGKWIESLATPNSANNPTGRHESSHRDTIDPLSEYQSWHMRMKMLVREAEHARETGQYDKSRDLLLKVDLMTREFADTRVSR